MLKLPAHVGVLYHLAHMDCGRYDEEEKRVVLKQSLAKSDSGGKGEKGISVSLRSFEKGQPTRTGFLTGKGESAVWTDKKKNFFQEKKAAVGCAF